MKRPDALTPGSMRYRFRKARFKHIESLLDDLLRDKPVASILDIGGRADYWRLLDQRFAGRVRIAVLNYKEGETVPDAQAEARFPIETMVGDGCAMPQFEDGAFDLAHSNSVIEHVGLFDDMRRFAEETRRVGRAYYVQTPNFWFPLEPHYGVPFFHWLPEPTRAGLHASRNVGYAKKTSLAGALRRVDHVRIVNRKVLCGLFPDGELEVERFALLTKSLIVKRPARGEADPASAA